MLVFVTGLASYQEIYVVDSPPPSYLGRNTFVEIETQNT